MQRSRVAKRALSLLFVATALTYFYGLGRMPFAGADEPRYAEVAREMFMRGDLVTPTLGGRTWFEKPALVYWAEIGSFKLFGVSEWSARLGPALAGWLTVVLVGLLAARVERRAGDEARGLGLACATVAASSAGFVAFSRAVNFDVAVTLTVTLSLASFFAAELEETGKKRALWLAGFYTGAGLSLLAKGLVGVVVPFGVAGLYSLLLRRRPAALRSLLWGLPVSLLVAGIWYAPVTTQHGRIFLNEFFVQHHFARYVSNKYHHPQPFYFYLLILPLLILPWTPFLIGALVGARRWVWRGDASAAERLRIFALAWTVMPVVFFSFSGSKLPGYVMPALPGATLLAGDALARFWRGAGGESLMRATGLILLSLAAAGAVFAARRGVASPGGAALIFAPLVLAGAWALLLRGGRARLAGAICGAVLLTAALIVACALGAAARGESVRDLLRAADERGYGAAPVLNLHAIERSSEFYAAGRVIYGAAGEPLKLEDVREIEGYAARGGGSVLVIVPVEFARQILDYFGQRAELIGDNGTHALLAVRVR